MEKKYYRYKPIILSKEAYLNGDINSKTSYKEFKYSFENNNYKLMNFLHRNLPIVIHPSKRLMYKNIRFYCYKFDEEYFDLITGQILTPFDKDKKTIPPNSILFDLKDLEDVEIHTILEDLKQLSRHAIKNYKKFIQEDIQTKYIYDGKIESKEEKEQREQIEKNQKKELENKVKKIRKII